MLWIQLRTIALVCTLFSLQGLFSKYKDNYQDKKNANSSNEGKIKKEKKSWPKIHLA